MIHLVMATFGGIPFSIWATNEFRFCHPPAWGVFSRSTAARWRLDLGIEKEDLSYYLPNLS